MNKYEIQVSDMNCGHCKARIEKALYDFTAPQSIEIDLEKKTVKVESQSTEEKVMSVIQEAGYTPQAIG